MLNRSGFLRATLALLSGVMALPTVSRLDAGESTVTPPEIGRSRRSGVDKDAVATLELGARQSLRLLQFTDNHLFCGVKEGLTRTGDDRNTERDWQALIQIFKPGAVIVTGDLWQVTPGTFLEEVCHEQESGQAAPVLATDHRLLACFCGHDHVNDYAVRTRQLDLVYGRATGHAGYGGEKLRKGAKLIELDLSDGTYAQETVFADGKRDKA